MDTTGLNPVQLDVVWKGEYAKAALNVDRVLPQPTVAPWLAGAETSEIVPLTQDRSSLRMHQRASFEEGAGFTGAGSAGARSSANWPPENAHDANLDHRASGFTSWQRPMRSTSPSREWWMGEAESKMARTRSSLGGRPSGLSRDSSILDEDRLARVTALWQSQRNARRAGGESLRVGYTTKGGAPHKQRVMLDVPQHRSLGTTTDSSLSPTRRRAARRIAHKAQRKRAAANRFAMEPLFSAGEFGGPSKEGRT